MDSKAQISIEMIIIMAAVVALVLFMVNNIHETADKYSKEMETKSNDLMKKIKEIE